jgi:pimeloyl-ACP methyl ester carboxylesterase
MRGLTYSLIALTFLGCGDDGAAKPDAAEGPKDAAPDAAPLTLGPPPELAMACADTPANVYTLPSGLPAMDDTHRGDVVRCATTESLSAFKVNAQIDGYNAGYTNTVAGHATSGFWSFRIAYRSTRNTVGTARAEGDTAAFLLVPEHPLAGAPLIVFGHGSTGVAAKCAPSHLDLSGAVKDEDYPPMLYRLAGAGYTVIAPDYHGFSYGQAPGYFNAEDEAHAILDATRAAAKILKTPPPKVAFVGHSQGAHAVISAQTYAESYGMTGTLVGVATLAPFWTSLTLFPAATTATANLSTTTDVNSILYAMEYAYSASELREGAGHGMDVFATAKRTAAKDTIVGDNCYDSAKLQALGATPADFFDTNYVNIVGSGCAVGGSCTDPLAAKWKARFAEDRPALDATGAPVLAMFGGADTTITVGRATCMHDKFTAELAAGGTTTTIQYCYNSAAGHRDPVRNADADYLISWVAAKAGIAAAPAACTDFPETFICPAVPQNY